MRIENGNARTLIKTLAAIPVYSGIQMLRELVKHGDITTDYEYNKAELATKAWQLSGMPGWLSDLVFNRFVGPGSKNSPFYVFAPALNILSELGMGLKEVVIGQPKKAYDRLERQLFYPEWRNWVKKFWFPRTGNIKSITNVPKATFVSGGEVNRKRFRVGGDPSIKAGEISKFNWDNLMQESDIGTQSAQASQLDELIDKKEAQKLMTDDLSLRTQLDTEIQRLKELKNQKVVTAQYGGIIRRKKYNQGDVVFGVNAEVNEIKKDLSSTPHVEEKETIGWTGNITEGDKNRIADNEGFVGHIYPDHLGNDTIGTGHLITEEDTFEKGKEYSKKDLDKYFEKDLKIASKAVDKLIDKSKIHPKAYGILVEMSFQMGSNKETGEGLAGFTETLKHINNGNYKLASKEMLKSKWHKQTPERAKRLSSLMADIFVDN